MKKILVFTLMLFILTGCKEKTLLAEQQGLNKSVLEYYELTNPSFESENLEAKIELVKVETKENVYYRYLVVFVPKYFDRMQFENVQIKYENGETLDFITEKVLFGQDMDLNMTLFPKHTKGDCPAFKNVEVVEAQTEKEIYIEELNDICNCNLLEKVYIL